MKRTAPVVHFRSLNVERDQVREGVLGHYVLTPNGLRAIRRILNAVAAGSGGAWTITGPFGTGKSAFCLYLTHLLAPPSDSLTSDAVSRLRQADSELADAVFTTSRSRLGFVPLAVSGTREPFAAAIIRALASADKISSLPGGRAIQADIKRLSRALPTGARSSVAIIAVLERLIAAFAKAPRRLRGIVLILDELGKLLEHASSNPDESDVFLLQQLAELASRSGGRLLLITVLHQDFRAYASTLPPLERAEWEKIRGRYEDILFEEPAGELLRFVALAWSELRCLEGVSFPPVVVRSMRELGPTLWRYDLAPAGLSQREGLKLLQDCCPLHPLVAVLLGLVFRRIGQNERSAITFLASEEPLALRAWVKRKPPARKLFDIGDLYEYLLASLGNGLLHTPDAGRWAEALEAEARHPSLSSNAVSVLRAVALLGICSRWYPVRPSRDVLCYALVDRVSPDELDEALAELCAASVVVRREHNAAYAIWEGSDIDIEARLYEGRDRIGRTSATATLLRKHHWMRPILARRHSFATGTLRFFRVEFCQADDLQSAADDDLAEHDGRILVVLPRASRGASTYTTLKRLGPRTLVRVLTPDERLGELALLLAAINWVWRNTPELSGDATARRELCARRMEVEKELDSRVGEFLRGAELRKGQWLYNGRSVSISDGRALNRRLSDICDAVFHAAPRIDNEIINRQELSSSAAAARRNLIERMIDQNGEESLGLEGNPPERSIYRSLLSDEGLGLHRRHRGVWGFRVPPPSHRDHSGSGFVLFEAIKRFLAESEETPRPVSELFDLLRQPPFGLRDGPIPVLICAALLAREADVALYRQGQFQPSLSSALFQDLIKRPADFAVRQLRISGVRSEVFDKLGSLLGHIDVAKQNAKQQVLTIARLLIRFTRSLPEHTQKTDGLSARTRGVRAVLLTAKEPETMLLADLPQAVDVRPFKTSDRRRSDDVETYVSRLRKAIVELRDCFPKLTASVWQSVGQAFSVGTEAFNIRAALRDRASALAEFAVERDMRMLIERMLEDSASDEAWLDGVASLLAERLPSKWRDEDLAHFGIRLRQFVRRFTLLEATVADRPKGAKLNGVESIRVALTSTRFGHVDHAIHLDSRKEAQAQMIEEKLDNLLDDSDPTVAVAALCRLLHRRVTGSASPRKFSREGVHA